MVRITLRRPEQRNALTVGMLEQMHEAILGVRDGCVLIEGEGKVFSGGFDLAACVDAPDGSVMRALLTGLCGVIEAVRACPAPVVVAAHRAAIAGACALAAGADFVVADRGARFGYPVVLLGVSPAVSGPTLGPSVGMGAARGVMLDPGLIRGERAAALGLVTDLVESAEEVGPAASRLAAALAGKPRAGLAATKRWLGEIDGVGADGEVGLRASLGLTGGAEERLMLSTFWGGRA